MTSQPLIPAQPAVPAGDRYVTFNGIDFEGNMARVLGHLTRYIDDPATGNAFWDRFKARLGAAEGGGNAFQDKLLLLHSHVYYMVDLFEAQDDAQALADLKKLEEECF
ncbi:N(2)-fixation sustaining protein CowN [Azorhizobium doebereinerae]|uniref:N(2)-fixation sustaining protein CowN n=1 Tax=Azorhizobium doebereinerae TaxID=281091 RepID=UPI00040FA231|nr:N(2)-fixation sustaining protein CowN [Azorhizobium doebereinerae]